MVARIKARLKASLLTVHEHEGPLSGWPCDEVIGDWQVMAPLLWAIEIPSGGTICGGTICTRTARTADRSQVSVYRASGRSGAPRPSRSTYAAHTNPAYCVDGNRTGECPHFTAERLQNKLLFSFFFGTGHLSSKTKCDLGRGSKALTATQRKRDQKQDIMDDTITQVLELQVRGSKKTSYREQCVHIRNLQMCLSQTDSDGLPTGGRVTVTRGHRCSDSDNGECQALRKRVFHSRLALLARPFCRSTHDGDHASAARRARGRHTGSTTRAGHRSATDTDVPSQRRTSPTTTRRLTCSSGSGARNGGLRVGGAGAPPDLHEMELMLREMGQKEWWWMEMSLVPRMRMVLTRPGRPRPFSTPRPSPRAL